MTRTVSTWTTIDTNAMVAALKIPDYDSQPILLKQHGCLLRLRVTIISFERHYSQDEQATHVRAEAEDLWPVVKRTCAMWTDQRIAGFTRLVVAALKPPPGIGRIVLALGLGIACYLTFAAAVLAVIAAMFFGLSEGFGRVS